ncbi:MAG: hypothetical protein PSX37_07370 [bacterium]|nr:hypothetical protein [bacterium]
MATEGATKVVTAVFSDADLRKSLIDAESPEQRREILAESGLTEGLTEEDFESLRQLAGDQAALNAEVLSSVSGGGSATADSAASDVNGAGYLVPSANAGGATIAGDVVEGASAAVVSTGMGAAAVGVVIGGAAFGF